MDLVDVPEHRRDPGGNANPCFHPSGTERFDRPPIAIHLISLAESGPEVSKSPIHPVNPGSNVLLKVLRDRGHKKSRDGQAVRVFALL